MGKRMVRVGTKFIHVPLITRIEVSDGLPLSYDEEFQRPHVYFWFVGTDVATCVFEQEALDADFDDIDHLVTHVCAVADADGGI
jgi:hypothetical protein